MEDGEMFAEKESKIFDHARTTKVRSVRRNTI